MCEINEGEAQLMGDTTIASRVDALLEDGFHGSVQDLVDALLDEDIETTREAVELLLHAQQTAGGARKSPRGQWYRTGKLPAAGKPRRGVSGKEIGSFARRLIFAPELESGSLILLTFREGSGAFRLRAYDAGATRPRMVWVRDANNDVVQLEKLFGPFEADIWWDDEFVKSVESVDYWLDVIGKQNAKLLGA